MKSWKGGGGDNASLEMREGGEKSVAGKIYENNLIDRGGVNGIIYTNDGRGVAFFVISKKKRRDIMMQKIRLFFTAAIALAASFVSSSALAVVDYIWDGDFDPNNLTKTVNGVTYTLNLNGNEIKSDADGRTYIEITNTEALSLGATISRSVDTAGAGGTVYLRYSNLVATGSEPDTQLCAMHINKTGGYNNISMLSLHDSLGEVRGSWADGFWNDRAKDGGSGTKLTLGSDIQETLVLSYTTSGAFAYLRKSDHTWDYFYKNSGSGSSTHSISGFSVGGQYSSFARSSPSAGAGNQSFFTNSRPATGMKIYAVAFSPTSTKIATDVNLVGFHWPTEPMPTLPTLAMWDRDFENTTKGSCTLTTCGNTIAEGGSSITINKTDATSGIKVDWTTGCNPITILVRYAGGIPAHTVMSTLAVAKVGAGNTDNLKNRAGVCVQANSYNTIGYWQGKTDSRATGSALNSSAQNGVYIFNYDPVNDSSTKGTNLKQLVDSVATSIHTEPGCVGSGDSIIGVAIGGNAVNNTLNLDGLVITGIAIVNGNLTDEQIVNFKWPAREWVGEPGADWSDASNWKDGKLPFAGDIVKLGDEAVVNVDANADLTGVTIQGSGMVIYDNRVPGNEKTSYQAADWTGTVWFKNVGPSTPNVSDKSYNKWPINEFGHTGSTVRFTNFVGYFDNNVHCTADLEIVDDANGNGWNIRAGGGSNTAYIDGKLKGTGTIIPGYYCPQIYKVADGSEFKGRFNFNAYKQNAFRFVFGSGTPQLGNSSLTVENGNSVTISSPSAWLLGNGVYIASGARINGIGQTDTNTPVVFADGAIFETSVEGPLTISGAITGAPIIDATALVEAGLNYAVVLKTTGSNKPICAVSTPGYEAYWKDNDLVVINSAAKAFYSRWENAPGILTWKSGQTITSGAKFSVFDITTCMDTTTEITDNVNSSVVPGYVGTSITPWHIFVKNGKGADKYKSPGYVIRLVPVADSTVTSLGGNFSPCNIGGLIVEEGASITSWTAGTPTTRVGYIGDMDAQQPTWTYIGNDFTFERSPLTFIGEVNLEIADGKTFTSSYTTSLDATTPTILKMIGAGTFAVTTGLNASGATLDFSRQSLSRQDTFILGGLTIGEATSFVFPAGLAQNVPYKLCSGTLTAVNGTHIVTVGEVSRLADLTFNTTDKTVSYQWSDAKNEVTLNADVAWNEIQWNAGRYIPNADIELTLTKDVSITFTEALTFTKPIKVLGGHTATFVCDRHVPTFVMDENWDEIIHLKNMNFDQWDFSAYTHNNSPIKFTGVTGYAPNNTTAKLEVEAILIDEGDKKAITVNNGYTGSAFTFNKISGSGTFTFSHATASPTHAYIFKDASEFTGKFENTKGLTIVIGNGSGAGYTSSAITYLADSQVKAGLGWSAQNAVFEDWMKVVGSVDDTLITVDNEPAKLAMVTLLNDDGTEKDGLYRLAYENGAVKIAVAQAIVLDIANLANKGDWSVKKTTVINGFGGITANSLTFEPNSHLTLDPIKTPIKLASAPTFGEGTTISLAEAYKDCELGRIVILTWTGDAITIPEGLLGEGSVKGEAVLSIETAPDGTSKQLVLTVGDYDEDAKEVSIMPMGDSITHGVNDGENYRISLMEYLASIGYKPTTRGIYNTANTGTAKNAAGVAGDAAWQYHSAFSGMMCRTDQAEGWEDSIDVALDAAGEPDFVTFMIGSNDMNDNGNGGVGNTSMDALFESWTNVVWKILRAKPNTRVICGTTTYASANKTTFNGRIDDFNTRIKAQIAKTEGKDAFPAGRVFVADINAACVHTDESHYHDYVHPNWLGHGKVAECWFGALKGALANTFEKTEITYNTKTTAAENVPAETYRKDFVRIATFTPTESGKLTQAGGINYTDVNDELKYKRFDRVGYYVELKRKDTTLVDYHDHVRFIWVDMNAFGDGDFETLGIPLTEKNQCVVENLHVYSNDTGIRNIAPEVTTAKGFVEFWPNSYSAGPSGVEGAPAEITRWTTSAAGGSHYDWNDSTQTAIGFGSMQVHRIFAEGESWTPAEVLFAFNRWTGSGNNEIGIGTFIQRGTKTADYTNVGSAGQGLKESMSASAYETMSIEIWGVPRAQCTWTGAGEDNDWANADNWKDGYKPTSLGDVAEIPVEATINVTSADVCGSVVAKANVTLVGDNSGIGAFTSTAEGSLTFDLTGEVDKSIVANGSITINVANGSTCTLNSVVSGDGSLVKTGAGTLILVENNTFSGGLTVNGGLVKAKSAATNSSAAHMTCLGTGAVTIDGGTVDFNGIYANGINFTLKGAGYDGNGALINTGAALTSQPTIGNITLEGDATIGGTATFYMNGGTLDFGAGYTLTKKGTFEFPMRGNAFLGTGKLIVATGTFKNNNGDNGGSNVDLEVLDGATLDFSGNSLKVRDFKCNGTVSGNNAQVIAYGTVVGTGKTIPKLKLMDGSKISALDTLTVTTLAFDTDVKLNLDFTGAPFADWQAAGTKRIIASTAATPANLGTVTGLAENWYLEFDAQGLSVVYATGDKKTDVANSISLGNYYVGRGETFTGLGGVQATTLTIAPNVKLTLDPVLTPVKIANAPVFGEGAKIALDAKYADYTKGVFTLLTWDGETKIDSAILSSLFDATSAKGTNPTVTQVTYTVHEDSISGTAHTYTALKLDLNPSAEKTPLKIMPLGDSITEGSNDNGFGHPNYRQYLLAMMAAKGYNVKSTGFRKTWSINAAGIWADEDFCWHNGQSGERLITGGNRAGLQQSVNALIEASEVPDVIVLKIGTNDAGTDINNMKTAWANVMWRIIEARPATKIIACSIMPRQNDDQKEWNENWRAAIADMVENSGFPENQVFYADLYGNIGGVWTSENFRDNLHPNWVGHAKNAQCIATAMEAALNAGTIEGDPKWTPNTKTGAQANVKSAYLEDMQQLAVFDPYQALTKGEPVVYKTKATIPEGTKFSRIGYYMELKHKRTGHVRYVWADMDNWEESGTFNNFEVPLNYQYTNKPVKNLHVDSNDSGIITIDPSDKSKTGKINFISDNDIGLMQVFEDGTTGVGTLFAFNNWLQTADCREIGIGDCALHSTPLKGGTQSVINSYRGTYNFEQLHLSTETYDLASIEIWGKVKNTCTWIGGASGNWSDKANWENGVPTDGDDVIIPDAVAITLNDNVYVATITIKGASASITGTGSIKVSNLAASTLKGTATIVIDGSLPDETVRTQLQANTWTGTAWLKDIGTWNDFDFGAYGHAGSKVKVTGITGYGPESTGGGVNPELILEDSGDTKAILITDGYGGKDYFFSKVSGSGTFAWDSSLGKSPAGPIYFFRDVTDFDGVLDAGPHLKIVVGDTTAGSNKGSITFADGIAVKAGLGWKAEKAYFGATIVVEGSLGDVLVSGLTATPTSLPGLIDAEGNDIEKLALAYEEGVGGAPNVIKLVAAGAKTNGKNYETIEQAINANNGKTIGITKDTVLDINALSATFKLDQESLADNKISWKDGAKYLACGSDGTLTVKGGEPTGEFTSFECYVLGIDASKEGGDKPVLNAPPDNGEENTLTASIDTARTIKGVNIKLIAVPDDKSETLDATGNSISLGLPGSGERIYTINVEVVEVKEEATNP